MRRKEREVTDTEAIREIISRCQCCRLGFYDGQEVYIVPLNFGVAYANEQTTFYFHSAKVGRKIDLISKVDAVGFEMDTGYRLSEAEEACEFTAEFQSVIGTGSISIVEDTAEKVRALQTIMFQTTQKAEWEFPAEMVEAVGIFKVDVKKISCKSHKPGE